jgi:hypothetical protein
MAATTESVKADAAEAPLLNQKKPVGWYQPVFGFLFFHSLV